jgi:hypothetical protein
VRSFLRLSLQAPCSTVHLVEVWVRS